LQYREFFASIKLRAIKVLVKRWAHCSVRYCFTYL